MSQAAIQMRLEEMSVGVVLVDHGFVRWRWKISPWQLEEAGFSAGKNQTRIEARGLNRRGDRAQNLIFIGQNMKE